MLYLVATPIGNLKDITLRALEVLREVDFVASEDTRKTGIMLKHFEIKKPQISFHEYNERAATERIIEMLEEGKSVALVTNAGTPSVSDPGFILVRAAIEHNLPVYSIPGPSAVILALTVSGLPVHSFTFRGFAPRKTNARRRFFEVDLDAPHTLIFYESPFRLKAFLEDALAVYGDRQACIANDLTKMFETVQRGKLSELIELTGQSEPRGEYTVVIQGKDEGGRLKDEGKRQKYPPTAASEEDEWEDEE